MDCDVAIVVYRPRWDELSNTLHSLSDAHDEFRTLRILVSGVAEDASLLNSLLDGLAIASKTFVYHRFDNLGFAGGQNFLLSKCFESGASWTLVYNPDLEIEIGALSEFLAICRSRGDRDLYGPWIHNPRGTASPVTIDSRGITWTASSRHFDIDDMPSSFEKFAAVEGLTGACLLVSKWVYQRLQTFDGEFFDSAFIAYREDAELGVRSRARGIESYCVQQEGIFHERGIPSASRKNALVNLLSVQNRLLMRWKLGRLRPGKAGLPTARDLSVLLACITFERASWPGVQSAFRVRRYARYKGWRFNSGFGKSILHNGSD